MKETVVFRQYECVRVGRCRGRPLMVYEDGVPKCLSDVQLVAQLLRSVVVSGL